MKWILHCVQGTNDLFGDVENWNKTETKAKNGSMKKRMESMTSGNEKFCVCLFVWECLFAPGMSGLQNKVVECEGCKWIKYVFLFDISILKYLQLRLYIF